MLRQLLAFILLSMASVSSFGQVSFQFIPEIQGRNIDGLFNCRILNSAGRQSASLSIIVREKKAGVVCRIQTPSFTLLPGNNIIPSSAVRAAKIEFASNKAGVMVSESNYFWEGDYEYCFALNPVSITNESFFEQCYDYGLTPFSELLLIEPYNRDSICDTRPMLSWQPLIPQIPGGSYQVVLTEVKDLQTATEAIQFNLPHVSQTAIVAPVLAYPSIAKELKKGGKYAWQVTAYKNQTVLNRSEIWEFTVACPDSTLAPEATDEGYRDIEDLSRGNFYVANGKLKFALVNSYNQQELRYEIVPVTSAVEKLKKMPQVKLETGKNKVTIDLSSSRLKDGNYYILKIWLPNGTPKSLRFLYKD